jgi:hypothetical protein
VAKAVGLRLAGDWRNIGSIVAARHAVPLRGAVRCAWALVLRDEGVSVRSEFVRCLVSTHCGGEGGVDLAGLKSRATGVETR